MELYRENTNHWIISSAMRIEVNKKKNIIAFGNNMVPNKYKYPDMLFRVIFINYGTVKSRMAALRLWYNNFFTLPF